jgi:hypothetical protein
VDANFILEPGVRLIPGTDPYTTAPQPIYGDPAATPFGAPVPGHPILLLVSLSCDANGKLSNIQFFNKPLGSDEQALKALRDFVMDRKTKADSIGAGLVVQIEAPAAIRFDNIQSVTEVINDSGAEIRFKVQDAAPTFKTRLEQGLPKSQGPLEISVVFVRDASGKKLSSKPVVCVDDEVLRPDELPTRLIQGAPPGSSAEAVRTLPSGVWITAEQDVPYEVLESVVRAVSQRGIQKVTVRSRPTGADPNSLHQGQRAAEPAADPAAVPAPEIGEEF